jgi:hypothetical protein
MLRWLGIGAAAAAALGLAIVLVVLALGAFRSETGTGDQSASDAGARTAKGALTPAPGESGATDWTLGRTFRDGDYTLRLLEYRQNVTEVGACQWTPANGQFVVMKVEIAYTGTVEGYFAPDEQTLRVAGGRTYPADVATAACYATHSLGLRALEPGESAIGYLAFDIDTAARPEVFEFKPDVLTESLAIPLG